MHDSREPTGLSPVLQDAQRLASSGRTIFPCKPDKTPLVAWKRAATTDPATIQNWWKRWPDAMIGLPTGHGLAVFDIDVDKATGKTFGEATARRMGLWELIRQGLLVNTPSGGLHAYFAGDVATSTSTIGPGIDTRGRGGYVIAPGSVNAYGTYRWETLCLTDVALPPLPGGLSDALSMERSFGVAGKLDQARSGAPPSLAGADEVREILSWIDPDAGGYDQWCKVLMGLHDHFAGSEEGLSIAEGWSSHGAKFRPREVPAKWASFQSGAGISIRTICEIARSNGADLALVARKHRAYARNARTHSEDQVALIAGSIREFGFCNPILVDGENGVIAGHGRLLAARKLGLDTVPVIELAHLTPAQKQAYILADNRLAEQAGWDKDLLALELGDLSELGVDFATLGFDGLELDQLLNSGAEDPREEDTPEPPEAPASRLGDTWCLGAHRLLCGDATDAAVVSRVLDGVAPHLMVTSYE